jgi:hypothetical protein
VYEKRPEHEDVRLHAQLGAISNLVTFSPPRETAPLTRNAILHKNLLLMQGSKINELNL